MVGCDWQAQKIGSAVHNDRSWAEPKRHCQWKKSLGAQVTIPGLPFLPTTMPGPFTRFSSCHPTCPFEPIAGIVPFRRLPPSRAFPYANSIKSPRFFTSPPWDFTQLGVDHPVGEQIVHFRRHAGQRFTASLAPLHLGTQRVEVHEPGLEQPAPSLPASPGCGRWRAVREWEASSILGTRCRWD